MLKIRNFHRFKCCVTFSERKILEETFETFLFTFRLCAHIMIVLVTFLIIKISIIERFMCCNTLSQRKIFEQTFETFLF